MSDPRAFFNGLRRDGSYLQPPLDEDELVRLLAAAPPDWSLPPEPDPRGIEDPTRAPRYGVDPLRLDSSGWAVVFPQGGDPRVRRALDLLLDLRKEQADQFYRRTFYEAGEGYDDFLARHHAPRGPADPRFLPYYVLLVGGPEEIPWEFQFQLDQVYAVGRVCFDKPEDYTAYARSVLDAEAGRLRRDRQLAFFAAEHPGDRASRRTHRHLAAPLAESTERFLAGKPGGWTIDRRLGEEAKREALSGLLADRRRPALLFAAAHGLVADGGSDDERRDWQGALITSDWRGEGGIGREHCFGGLDLDPESGPAGLVAFLFACFSAGTPSHDQFWKQPGPPPQIADKPFAANLARCLTAHRRGGALAVIGHVDRAWTTSFDWFLRAEAEGAHGSHLSVFEQALESLVDGVPVGAAMEYFGQFSGDLATELNDLWTDRHQRGSLPEPRHFARLRTAAYDVRNYVVFGDPAVRLAI